MKNTLVMNFTIDKVNNKINVERAFDAPLDEVWSAWTESEHLDQWWAPHPYRAETKSMEFREGGKWLYSMAGPEGDKHWAREDFISIKPQKQVVFLDAFCDENGRINNNLPRSTWSTVFKQTEDFTLVSIEISYDKPEDLETLMKMGFKEGFTAGLENLDHYLDTQFRQRKGTTTKKKARVTTYLMFPGKAEEALNFYKKVFKGTFTGAGLKRYGDVKLPASTSTLSDAEKNLIIHGELTILGGHVLMASDSPKGMASKLVPGNTMSINVEPESKEETERIFKALSEEGEVVHPLADMFWGAYYGQVKDKYGINWMLNYKES